MLLREAASPIMSDDSPTTTIVKSDSLTEETAAANPLSLSHLGSQPVSKRIVLFGNFWRTASAAVIVSSGFPSPDQLLFISALLLARAPTTVISSMLLLTGRVSFSFLSSTNERSAAVFA